MRVQLIARPTQRVTGLSRYTIGLREGLEAAGVDVGVTVPNRPPFPSTMVRGLKRIGVDLETFFDSYPLRVRRRPADVYHLTDQMLATLLLLERYPAPVAVTVMDIIPYLVHQVPELNTLRHAVDRWFYGMALSALRRADALIAISEYTKRTLVEVIGLPEDRIAVIYPAIDDRRFRPSEVPARFFERYGLSPHDRHLLVVGTDDPRKNLGQAIRAAGLVRQAIPNIRLIRVGASQFPDEHRRLERLIDAQGLSRHVVKVGFVPEQDLPLFYNLAEVCLMPSLYEGFGLPVAEAMSCGTPVICVRAGPLPEVAGDSAVQVSARDDVAMAEAILRLLHDPSERERLSLAGRARARRFTRDRQAEETQALYAALMERGQATR